MRLALLTARPDLARGLFPAYFDPIEEVDDDPVTDVALDREDAQYDYSQIEWESPSDMGDAEFDMLQQMLSQQHITVVEPSEAPEGVEHGIGLNAEPEDAEWT